MILRYNDVSKRCRENGKQCRPRLDCSFSQLEDLGPQLPIQHTVKTDQTGWMTRLTESLLGAHIILLVLSCSCSNNGETKKKTEIKTSDMIGSHCGH